ncbi:MAG: TIGR03435 family protein [Bryobacteraceae bacterium]|jgi:uncharacterized protein (TIGR03435 family)
MLRFSLLLFSAALLYGQQFEAATIKQPPPPDGNRMFIGINGGPGTADPGRINYENVSLKMLLTKAYGVQDYQISGPDWLDSERFNVAAKLPDGATKEQFQKMLQNLLIERFKMVVHKEKKDLPAYALVVAKNGPRLKPSTVDPAATLDAQTPGPPPGGPVMGKDGFPEMRAGGRGIMMAMTMGRGAKMATARASMQELAERLGSQLGRPVVDQTGLTGKYEFTLYFSMEGLANAMGGIRSPQPTPPPGAVEAPSDAETAPSLQTAIQEQLGLRLESRKMPLDLIVIDHIEKVPTEN